MSMPKVVSAQRFRPFLARHSTPLRDAEGLCLFTTSKRRALLAANGHDDRASAAAASPAAVGAGNGCGASWRGGHGAGGVGVREVELAAIDGSVPVDRTILVPVSHVAVVDDAEIVGVFMAVGGELCSVEGQTTRDVGGRDGADR